MWILRLESNRRTFEDIKKKYTQNTIAKKEIINNYSQYKILKY